VQACSVGCAVQAWAGVKRMTTAQTDTREGSTCSAAAATTSGWREKDPCDDKQSQIAERKTVGRQGPGDRSKEAAYKHLEGLQAF